MKTQYTIHITLENVSFQGLVDLLHSLFGLHWPIQGVEYRFTIESFNSELRITNNYR